MPSPRRLLVRAAAAAAAAVACLAVPTTSLAALKVPRPTSPAQGATVDAMPSFQWNGVAGADHYEFQLAADSGFNSPVLGQNADRFTTRDTRATVLKTVPNASYYWRVRAITAKGAVSKWTSPQLFVKAWVAAPVPIAPANGAAVSYPSQPLIFSWTPVPHAYKYLVSIGTDPRLGSLVGNGSPIETESASFSPTFALAPATYYWSVTPEDAEGFKGAASTVRSFTWLWPSTTGTHVTDLNPAPEVVDPQFSWDPVPGAAHYEVEINSSQDFPSGSKVCCGDPTTGTSLSPVNVFANNTYYWRVRAFDSGGDAGVWNVGPSFDKTFDSLTPSVNDLRMADNNVDPGVDIDSVTPGYQTHVPVVRWDPVPGASSYEVDVTLYNNGACDWAYPANEHWVSRTATTAWTPLGAGWVGVKPYPDGLGVSNDVATSMRVGDQYCVRVHARTDRDVNGSEVYGPYTYINPTGYSFQWEGPPAGSGCTPSCNAGYLGAGDYNGPQTGTVLGSNPVFTWKPLPLIPHTDIFGNPTQERSYYVLVSKDADFTKIVDYAFVQIPAYAPRTVSQPTTFSDETTLYYWLVFPATFDDGAGSTGAPPLAAPQSFQKESAPPVPLSPVNNTLVTGQPSFHWSPVLGARNYRLQVSADPTFGAPIDDVTTDATAYTSSSTYPANGQLYWRVRANDENLVGLTWSQSGTFVRSLPSPTPDPANPVAGDLTPTFLWAPVQGATAYDFHLDVPDGTSKDFTNLQTAAASFVYLYGTGVWKWSVRAEFPNQSFGTTPGPYSATYSFLHTLGEPGAITSSVTSPTAVLLSWLPKLHAKTYRIEVSKTADFSQTTENVTTDNTSYAPALVAQDYLDGGTFLWRVAAIDADSNQSDWATGQFTLPIRLVVSESGLLSRGKRAPVIVTVKNPAGKPVRSVHVTVSGAGVHRTGRTNKRGIVVIKVRPTKKGTLTFTATRKGYQTGLTTTSIL